MRNNWLNQKDSNCAFSFPGFEDFTIFHSASFEEIRTLYKADQSSLANMAPRLTVKVSWPPKRFLHISNDYVNNFA